MERNKIKINDMPAIIWGETSDRLYLYIHGQGGSKEEAEGFSEIACAHGWQVLSIDLPEHGDRKAGTVPLDPWHVIPELQMVLGYAKKRWNGIALYAVSIGVWFGLMSAADIHFTRCLFVSPVVDMRRLIETMMMWAGVNDEKLKAEKEIATDFGQTLSWEYLTYVRNHPVSRWESPTSILYAEKDELISSDTISAFKEQYGCSLQVMEGGEHWFHTREQLAFLKNWIEENI